MRTMGFCGRVLNQQKSMIRTMHNVNIPSVTTVCSGVMGVLGAAFAAAA
jgi:hypothetical protein